MPYSARSAVIALAAVALGASAGSATTVTPPTFEELVDQAGRIVVTEVVRVQPRIVQSRDGRAIVTAVTFRSARAVKGADEATFVLEFLGGTVGDETLEIIGAPRWVVGDRDVLFVTGRSSRLSPLVRMMHGRVRVTVDAAGVQTVAFHSGDPIVDLAAFTPGTAGDRRGLRRAMTLTAFVAAVEARVAERAGK